LGSMNSGSDLIPDSNGTEISIRRRGMNSSCFLSSDYDEATLA